MGFFSSNRKKEEAYQRERAEKKRLEGCAEILHEALSDFGYIAQEVVTKSEISDLVDSGIDPDDPAGFISTRIIEYDALVLGEHRGIDLPVKLKQDFRDRHIYIVGKSGSGKTNLIRDLVIQHMDAGDGVGVIAPEAEMLTEELLPFVPEDRLDDVVYFNPADSVAPISFNPLQLEQDEDLDARVDENMTVFTRLMGNESTPRTNEILRQAFYALLPIPDTTLLDIPKMLDRENTHYLSQLLTRIEDPDTLHFWRDIYPQFPKNAHLPLTYRLSRFTRAKSIRNVLCRSGQRINFRQIMDEGKIAFFNLSDGILGEQNSQLLGQLIVSKFQLAVMGRADTPKNQRPRFTLFIDEFQTFTQTASTSYEKILSRARKYRLSLVLAHQQTSQIPAPLLKEIFGNVSTMISFVVSREDAKRLAPEFISTAGGEVKAINADNLVALKVGSTYAKIGTTSFPMKTRLVTEKPNWEIKEEAIRRSRANYGTPSEALRAPQMPPESSETSATPFDLTDPDEAF